MAGGMVDKVGEAAAMEGVMAGGTAAQEGVLVVVERSRQMEQAAVAEEPLVMGRVGGRVRVT